jgi:hypothetical protein
MDKIKEWIDRMPNINHANAEPLTTVNHVAKTLTQQAAFKNSEDLFEGTWRLFRKPYVCKEAINRGLLNFVRVET